ncbi:MAG TPA: hypothetical protein PLW19_05260, partial [Anaerolineaceae bacterium]|nr:hypothetical protein [Anaerolineaceae bacterium]
MTQHRHRLALEVNPISPDSFEILAITAGTANGWTFSAEVLRESLALWDGVNCFVDHDLVARSVRDIAGVLRKPSWDENAQGVRAELQAFGPSAHVLSDIGRQILEISDEPAVKVGFSADVLFKGTNGKVEKILRIFSVDLVYNPARGGIFLRALNQLGIKPIINGEKKMNQIQEQDTLELQSETGSAEDLSQDLQSQLSEIRNMRREMSAFLLESSLVNTNLPPSMQSHIRERFQGRTFAPAELQSAIKEHQKLLSELDGGRSVKGHARV